MLVRSDEDSLLLIRQTDHARVVGDLAVAWGAEPWARPEPYHAVWLAAALHDEGWSRADEEPVLDPESGLPTPFWAIPYRERAAFYREGIAEAAEQNAYAGLLVSLHLSALWAGYGIRPSLDLAALPEEEAQAVVSFLNGEAARQAALRSFLLPPGVENARAFDEALGVNLRWLAIWDWLSLLLCLDADPGDTLDGRAATPGPARTDLPLDYAGSAGVDLQVRRLAPGTLGVAPYPFVQEPLHLTVAARRLPLRRFESQRELLSAYGRAPVVRLDFAIMSMR